MSFGSGAALEAGTGDDMVVVEQGIALEGLAKFGEAEEMIETVDIPPVQAVETPQPVEEIKPELTDVVTSTEGKHEEQVMTEEPKPVEEEHPTEVPVKEQAPQVATLIEQSSGAAQEGGDTTQRRAYLGQVRKTLERSKVNPRSTISGTVMIRFTVGPKGELALAHGAAELRLEAPRRRRDGGARSRGALPAAAAGDRERATRSAGPLPLRHALRLATMHHLTCRPGTSLNPLFVSGTDGG